MGKAERLKGHDFERDVAKWFREELPETEARRGLQYRDGADAPDVVLKKLGFFTECKAHKQVRIQAAMRKALTDIKKRGLGEVALVVSKDDYARSWLVTMLAEDWMELLKSMLELEQLLEQSR